MATINIDDKTYVSEVEDSEVPVLIDFSASWCGPCKMLKPIIEELSQEYDGKVKIVEADVENCPDLVQKFGVRGVPTLVLMKDGNVVEQQVGAQGGKVKIVELIEKAL